MTTIDLLGRRFPIPSLFRLPMYYHYLVQTLKLLDQWADEHPSYAPALGATHWPTELAANLDACAAQQMVADLNRYFLPTFRSEGGLEGLPAQDFLQFCYFHHCLEQGKPPELWDGKAREAAAAAFRIQQDHGFATLDAFHAIPEAELHPLTLLAIRHRSESLWNGLALLCQRFEAYRKDLGTYFFDGDSPTRLLQLRPLEAQTRKGGGQSYGLQLELQSGRTAALVYRPFDLERDFLVVGDQAHAFRLLAEGRLVDPVIVAALEHLRAQAGTSLLAQLCAAGLGGPALSRILPLRPGSSLADDAQGRIPQLRESHGFLLPVDPAQWGPEALGRLAALAQLLGIELRRQALDPTGKSWCLSLETQSAGLPPSLAETDCLELLGPCPWEARPGLVLVGGYRGLNLGLRDATQPPAPPNEGELAGLEQGYRQALPLLIQQAGLIQNWLRSCRQVIVRICPYPPSLLEVALARYLGAELRYDRDGQPALMDTAQLATALQNHGQETLLEWSHEQEAWLQRLGNPFARTEPGTLFWYLQPAFCIFPSRALLLDLVRGDLPSTYHRLGSRELLGSEGSVLRFSLSLQDQPRLTQGFERLYGGAPQRNCPYFPKDSLALLVDRLSRLAADPTACATFTANSLETLRRHGADPLDA